MNSRMSRMKMHEENEKKNYIIAGIFLIIVLMTSFFASYIRKKEVEEKNDIKKEFSVELKGIVTDTFNSSASNKYDPYIKNNTANFGIIFKHSNNIMIYKITINNNGKKDAILDEIKGIPEDELVTYKITGIKVGDIINSDEIKIMTISLEYNDEIIVENIERDIHLIFNFSEY